MANQLTLRVMETIVKRCEGYEPLPEAKHPLQVLPVSRLEEEALLSAVIHKQTEVSGRMDEGSKTGGGSRQSHPGSNFSRNGGRT